MHHFWGIAPALDLSTIVDPAAHHHELHVLQVRCMGCLQACRHATVHHVLVSLTSLPLNHIVLGLPPHVYLVRWCGGLG